MLDYQFIIKDFCGEKHYYIERFDKELNDYEVREAMNNVFSKYEDAKSIIVDKIFRVKD